jgi:hypothetical protein
MIWHNNLKTEYLGYYVDHVKHYDRWDEYVNRICTRSVPAGTDGNGHIIYRTETYDCSYVDNHPEYWVMVDNDKQEYKISRERFNELVGKWKTPMIFIDMKRNYHSIDGDAQKYQWDGKIEHSVTLTQISRYTNKIQASHSIFNLGNISKQDVKLYGLYDYPKTVDNIQNNIIGLKEYTSIDEKYMNFVNGYLGKKCEFRTYLLAFYGVSQDISFKQRSYWNGGNMNELVICVGLDSLNNNNLLLWGQSFSWSDDKMLEIMVNEYLFSKKGDSLNVVELSEKLMDYVPKYWKIKDFEDFNYINPTLTNSNLVWLSIILLIINVIVGIIIVYYNRS